MKLNILNPNADSNKGDLTIVENRIWSIKERFFTMATYTGFQKYKDYCLAVGEKLKNLMNKYKREGEYYKNIFRCTFTNSSF